MDAYEATKIVFSRIQSMDPENAAAIMGLLLMQEHGEKEMIRLAFGPESLLQSVVLKARKEQDDALFPLPLEGSDDGVSWAAGETPLGWKQCLYYSRGYCKNGSTCRFFHEEQQQLHELVGRSKSSQLMASAASFVPSSSPTSTANGPNLLLRHQLHQREENQRAAAAILVTADEHLKYLNRVRMERSSEYLGTVNPGSRQIYLTFPADSTFREEDVSNYFSIYGPVQDVRIPYQQKRMFGFVTFLYPETVKLILAKGNPHFVCSSRVLVKPYKEKGKIFEKKMQQQQQQQMLLMERCDHSGCLSPNGLDCRVPYDLQQLGARMLFSNKDELLLRRKMVEQQAEIELQHAIELHRRQFAGLQLLDLRSSLNAQSPPSTISAVATTTPCGMNVASSSPEEVFQGVASSGKVAAAPSSKVGSDLNDSELPTYSQEVQQEVVNSASAADGNDKNSTCHGKPNKDPCQESAEHNLPDSPFASPTKLSCLDNSFSTAIPGVVDLVVSPLPTTNGSRLTAPLDISSSFESCFFPMQRFSSNRAIGM